MNRSVRPSHVPLSSRAIVLSITAAAAFGPMSFGANPNAATQPSDATPAEQSVDGVVKGWTPAESVTGRRMKQLATLVVTHLVKHDDHFPSDLGSVVELLNGKPADCFQTPGDERQTTAPQPLTPDWVNANASYVYLASDVLRGDLNAVFPAAAAKVIILHTRLDQPFDDTPRGPAILVTYVDGHTNVLPVDQAREDIDRSKTVLDAARAKGEANRKANGK